jgi:hypothetical protein
MTANFDSTIEPILENANRDIQMSIRAVIRQSTLGAIGQAGPILNRLLLYCNRFRRFSELDISDQLLKFLESGPEALQFARANNWLGLLGLTAQTRNYREVGTRLGAELSGPVLEDEELEELNILRTIAPSGSHTAGSLSVNSLAARRRFLSETDPGRIHDYLAEHCTNPEDIRELLRVLSEASAECCRACIGSTAVFAGWTSLTLPTDCAEALDNFLRTMGREHPDAMIPELRTFLDKPDGKTVVRPEFFSLVLDIVRMARLRGGAWPELDGFHASPQLNELREYLNRAPV